MTSTQISTRKKFFEEFKLIPHYIRDTDRLKTELETIILVKLGRIHYDYTVPLYGARDLICSFNVIVGHGDNMLDCLMSLCIKLKDEIYNEVRGLFYDKFRL